MYIHALSNAWEFYMDCDVLVIGGGPAGSTMAYYLAEAGLDVLILEKDTFPRNHPGESLVPFCYGIFEELGVLDKFKNTFVRKPGVRFLNRDASEVTTYCFKNIIKGEEHLSFHVWRYEFDHLLLQNAEEKGAKVRQNCKVTGIHQEEDQTKITFINEKGEKENVLTQFLVDASGQDTFLSKKQRTKEKHPELDRVAFVSHWKNYQNKGGINEGLLQIVNLDGASKGWFGIQAVGGNRLSVGLVVDNKYLREQKKKQNNSDWISSFYHQEISKATFVHQILEDAKQVQEIAVVSNFSYSSSLKYGNNFAMVGDAASFIDPIFASGIFLAMNSSKLVAKGIIEQFQGDTAIAQIKFKEAYQRYEGAIGLLDRFIRLFYNPDAISLSALENQVESDNYLKHKVAFAMLHFIMAGDFFEEYEKYHKYLDFLEQPRKLDHFKHFVIDRPNFQETTCGLSIEDVFPELVNQLSQS